MKALLVEGLTKAVNSTVAVNDLSFSVERGAVHALVGQNGSGKSTTLKMIAGLLRPDNGLVTLFGKPVDGGERSRVVVGYMPENPVFRGEATAVELLDFYLKLFGLRNQDRINTSQRLLEEVGLLEQSNMKISTYTKGMRQRLGLAQALVGDPELLLLDEPCAGLDPLGVMRFRGLIRSLAAGGTTVLLSTHDLDEVERLCDEVTMLDRGHAVISGTVDEIHEKTGTTLLDVELVQVNETVVRALRSLPFVENLRLARRTISLRLSTTDDVRPIISKTVTSCGGVALSFGYSIGRMEDAFLRFVVSKDSERPAPFGIAAPVLQQPSAGGVRSVIEVKGETHVGGHITCKIDIVNVGSTPVWLTRVEDVVPEGVGLEDIPSRLDTSERIVSLGDQKLDPLQTKTLRFGLMPIMDGRFGFRPMIHYIDSRGEKRISLSSRVTLEVAIKDAIRTETEGAARVLDYLKVEFLRDSLDFRLNRESAGWRSMVQIANGTGTSVSSLYGKNGHFGKAISDLLGKGVIESKTFRNQRGRGGEVLRFRIRAELDWLKRDLEQRENAWATGRTAGRQEGAVS